MYSIADTGATQNYIKVDTPCINKFKTHQVPQVILTDGRRMQAKHKSNLKLGPLLKTGRDYTKLTPYLKTEPQSINIYPTKWNLRLQQNSHAPPRGTKTLVHDKSHNRGTWVSHGQ